MNMRTAIIPVLVLLLLAGVVAAPDFVGTWIGKTQVPDGSTDDLTIVIQNKDNVYSGTIVDTLGYAPLGTELKEIKVEKNEMSFQFFIVDGSLIVCRVALKDETLTGAWTNAEGDGAAVVLERKK
jgi:hypothetical protein